MGTTDKVRGEAGAYDPEIEDLLWQLSTLRPSSPGSHSGLPVSDRDIESYRRGSMSPAEQRRFERRLAGDEEGMARLARLGARTAAARLRSWRLAATLLVGTLATTALVVSLHESSVAGASDVPTYAVAIHGVADGEEPRSLPSPEARPGSKVRMVARPATRPDADPEFALYRHGEPGVLQIADASTRIRVARGTAVLEVEATALVGSEPGLHRLVLLIGPDDFTAPASVDRIGLDELVNGHGVQIYAFDLRLLSPDEHRRSASLSHEPGNSEAGRPGARPHGYSKATP